MSAEELIDDARMSASRAIQFDKESQLSIAAFHYAEAAHFLELAARLTNDDKARAWRSKAAEYTARKEEIEEELREARKVSGQSEDQNQLQRCHFLLSQALDADEAGLQEEAVELYAQSVENALKAKSQTSDPELQKKLGSLARQALDRAEVLKGIDPKKSPTTESTPIHAASVNASATSSDTSAGSGQTSVRPTPGTGTAGRPELHRGYSSHLKVVGGSDTYTEEEKRVLLSTSKINGIEYVPFMSIDLKERFRYAIPFTDKDPPLALAPKQRQNFQRWARPQELCNEPVLIANKVVDFYCIKQTVISDCSLVASLAVSAQYERRFGQRLITSVIYPRNKDKEPICNPFGKYMIKLHLNGVPRKVIIDDLLPVGRHGELLCSYSTNRNELWVSLIEKAYMKVMGGYDFPGSNSNIDLHALTGWIPERVAIRPKEADFNAAQVFQMLETNLRNGNALVTIATGELSEIEADRAGLVPTHAYAVLDVRRINGVNLLKLKNPWSHLRWRGNYSELDLNHWTPALKEALNYDPNCAATFDNGVFWIDYDSILRFFDVFYLNWNPKLFKFTYCIHQSWKAGLGPIKDVYNIGENPQFRLEIGPGTGEIWLLLTRHIVDIVDFKENREYITTLVYKTNGRRVFYPNDPPPFIDGVRINSPHYLCKMKISESSSRLYTLVISQYEKMNTIYYTLRAYSTLFFKMTPLKAVSQYKKEVSGQWDRNTAGGCANYRDTYQNNPRYQIVFESSHNENSVLIDLKGPKQYQVGFDIRPVILNDSNAQMEKKSSGAFRSGFVVLELENVAAGTYELVPATFYPGLEGPFILTVKSSCPVKLGRLQ